MRKPIREELDVETANMAFDTAAQFLRENDVDEWAFRDGTEGRDLPKLVTRADPMQVGAALCIGFQNCQLDDMYVPHFLPAGVRNMSYATETKMVFFYPEDQTCPAQDTSL